MEGKAKVIPVAPPSPGAASMTFSDLANEKKATGKASGKRRCQRLACVAVLGTLVLAGIVLGVLFAMGFFVYSKVVFVATTNSPNITNSTTVIYSASALPAQLAISGINAAIFDAEAQLHFKVSVAHSIDSNVKVDDIHIISFSDEFMRRRHLTRTLSSAYLLINFAVLTRNTETVLKKMQDSASFLRSVQTELIRKGPFTVAKLLTNLYVPPTSSDNTMCDGMNTP